MMLQIKDLKRTCYACPSQWEGTLEDGHMIYIRYRHGRFSVSKSPTPTDDVMDAVGGIELYSNSFDEPWGGYMDDIDMFLVLDNAELIEIPFLKKIYFKHIALPISRYLERRRWRRINKQFRNGTHPLQKLFGNNVNENTEGND